MKYWQLFSVSSIGSYAKVNKLIFLLQHFFIFMLAYSFVCHFLDKDVCSTKSVRLRNDLLVHQMSFLLHWLCATTTFWLNMPKKNVNAKLKITIPRKFNLGTYYSFIYLITKYMYHMMYRNADDTGVTALSVYTWTGEGGGIYLYRMTNYTYST